MDWKREAIDKLRQYEAKRTALMDIPGDIAQLESSVKRIRSAVTDGTPVRGGGSGREDMLLNNIVKREELKVAYKAANEWVDRVNKGLAILDAEEKLILDRFYIAPAKGNVERLCEELCIEQSSVYRRRDKALHRFTLALYGCIET